MLFLDFTRKGKTSFSTNPVKVDTKPVVAPTADPIIIKPIEQVIEGDILSKPIILKPKTAPQNNIRFVI
jgi:hypothetical protein